MAVLLGFAFVSGVITILSPCILPVLPIVLASSTAQGKARPFGVVAGFVVSFTVFTLTLTAVVQALGISADALRIVAVVIIALFGLVLIIPQLQDRFELLASKIASRGSRSPKRSGAKGSEAIGPGASASRTAGFLGGLPVGVSLGLVWTPCVGPIMASVISLALTQRVDGGAIFITLAYSLGTSIPMLGVMLGGRALINRVPVLTKNLARIQKGFGVLMIAVAVMIAVGWDRKLQTAILRVFPSYGSGLTALENTDPVQGALEAREVTRPDQPGSGLSMVDVSGGAPETFSPSPRPRDGRLADYGPAPQIVTRGRWYNTEDVQTGGAGDESAKTGSAGAGDAEAEGSGSGENPAEGSPPLSMEELRGKVVIVDFWTYSCVNCVRTIPYLKSWYDEYRARGLVIIGVHTPEFEFEKNPSNVARAVSDLGIDWPVVLDNDYRQWRAYSNRYWPAHYFIDAEGRVRYFHFGEGEYDTSEKVIRALLKEAGEKVRGRVSNPDFQYYAHTPETYLGYGRSEGFTSAVDLVADRMTDYRPGGTPDNAEWSLAGTWAVKREYVVPESEGVLAIGFNAKNVFLVVEPEEPGGEIRVKVDGSVGSDTPDVKDGILMPDESRLYQLVGLEEPGEHVLSLEVKGKLRLFAFTFG